MGKFARQIFTSPLSLVLLGIAALTSFAPRTDAAVVVVNNGGLGVIKGIVRDDGGTPIADASVAIFRAGTTVLLKQVSSASDGSFLARIMPGRYTVLAVAEGFNPVSIRGVEVSKAAELTYGFNLERAGNGNTLPEKRADRNSSKWRIKAAAMERAIYQHHGDADPVAVAEADVEDDRSVTRKGQSAIETYFGSSERGSFGGLNFATLIPVGEATDVVFAGQTGVGPGAPQRVELAAKFSPYAKHQVRVSSSASMYSHALPDKDSSLGQLSFQGTDEWAVGRGVIVVMGLDYSRFVGASSASSLSPRLGLQFDINSKTRVRSAFTTQTEDRSWAHALDLESESVAFPDPVAVEDFAVVNGKQRMNRSSRLEFGVERVLDNNSSVEANVFFDMTADHGVGLNALNFTDLGGTTLSDFVADQQGKSEGVRMVYTRRLGGPLTASAGYSAGVGQRLSPGALIDPAHVFDSDFFQSFFAQLAANLKSGTNVRTIYRLSPEATVFAIDPFKGSLAIYDPGLSVFVTQSLPSLGLPLRAQAVIDARNIFGFQNGVSTEEGRLRLNAQGPTLRGGIKVQF